jgi:hypothetical protein
MMFIIKNHQTITKTISISQKHHTPLAQSTPNPYNNNHLTAQNSGSSKKIKINPFDTRTAAPVCADPETHKST